MPNPIHNIRSVSRKLNIIAFHQMAQTVLSFVRTTCVSIAHIILEPHYYWAFPFCFTRRTRPPTFNRDRKKKLDSSSICVYIQTHVHTHGAHLQPCMYVKESICYCVIYDLICRCPREQLFSSSSFCFWETAHTWVQSSIFSAMATH